jgi:hypothetical protein
LSRGSLGRDAKWSFAELLYFDLSASRESGEAYQPEPRYVRQHRGRGAYRHQQSSDTRVIRAEDRSGRHGWISGRLDCLSQHQLHEDRGHRTSHYNRQLDLSDKPNTGTANTELCIQPDDRSTGAVRLRSFEGERRQEPCPLLSIRSREPEICPSIRLPSKRI